MFNNPYLQQMQQQLNMQPMLQQPINGAIQVNDRSSAMQYQLPPNSTSPALFDTNGKTFYIVTTDGTGAKTCEAFDYNPHIEDPAPSVSDMVTRAEFQGLVDKVNELIGANNGIHGQVQAAATDAASSGSSATS